jgi:hypothetical protein
MAYIHAGWRQKRFRRRSGASLLLPLSLAALFVGALWLWAVQ